MGKLPAHGFIRTSVEIREIVVGKTSLKGLTGGWTKWGGAKHELYINQWDRDLGEWYCQNCGKKSPHELTPYMYEFPEKEFVRVCAPCFNEGCPKLASLLENP